MRSSCVAVSRRPFADRLLVGVLAALTVFAALGAPDAEAARRKRRAAPAYAPPYASIVYDVNAGKVLQENQSNALRHPASVTKVMTLYLLFEQLEKGRFRLDSPLRVSAEAAAQAPSKLGLRPGETISAEDAIKALVTKSANDIAVVVAEAIGGDEDRFAQMMTAKARALGMSRSVFRNASGLPNPQQVTTARDLVTLGKAIHDRFPRYYAYFSIRSFSYDGGVHRNHNRLLGKVEGIDGIKTGFTRASGFNLLTSAKVEGRHIITVVLGGRSARSRDAAVAELIEESLPHAYAGRRLGPKSIEVAAVDDEPPHPVRLQSAATNERRALPEPRLPVASVAATPISVETAARSIPLPSGGSLPLPPGRPKPAYIAEVQDKSPDANLGLTKGRPIALAAGGSTAAANAGTTPLALMATTPRSPALRWTPGPQAAMTGEGRMVPPANVRYTNAIPTVPSAPEPNQPLPDARIETMPSPQPGSGSIATPKTEERLPNLAARAEIAARTPLAAPDAARTIAALPAVPAVPPVTAKQISAREPVFKAAPARAGWIIQLAATDDEGKARTVLERARSENSSVLKSAEPFTETVSKGSATLYRARFAGFEAEEAQNACKALKKNGFNCFAQKL